MKKILLVTILACAAAVAAPFAQAPPPPPGGPGGPPPEVALKEFFALTDAQAASLQTLLDTRQQAIQAILPQLDSAEKALGDALKGTSPDPTQLGNLLLTVHGFREQLRAADAAAGAGFKALLTADQQTKMDQVVALLSAMPALDALQQLHLLPPPSDGGPGGGGTGRDHSTHPPRSHKP